MPTNFHVESIVDDDDKYAKFAAAKETPDAKTDKKVIPQLKQYDSKLGVFNFETVSLHFFIFVCFVLASGYAFTLVGGTFNVNLSERFGALQLEILGLVMLRKKIKNRDSVSGISGMTFVMYAVVYFSRIFLALPTRDGQAGFLELFDPNFQWKDVDFDVTLGCCSFLLVLDILKSVFVTHYKTYEAELDVFKAWYLIPACWATALLVRPHFESWTFMYSYGWSSTLYMDVLALMPQVVMMAKSGGKVETPIANFVAATSISRCGDLFHSLFMLGYLRSQEPFSYWLAVSVQIVHLLLVADFMYYFCKARTSANKETQEISLVEV